MKKNQLEPFMSLTKAKKVLLMTMMLSPSLYSEANNDAFIGNNYYFQSQKKTITGVVIDESGIPIIGANIKIKGTSEGIITDIDGKFTLQVSEGAVLEISYVGYSTKIIKTAGQTTFSITLIEDTQTLSEVVVVGYGSQKKESVVGAITQAKGEDLMQSGGVVTIGEALQGKLPGVTAIQSSGRPGDDNMKIYIRGQSSWNGGQPLVLVDGIERSMNDVDMNEVESISVLKDASATAVFGVKGANGVILLTTKRGNEGKAQLSISASNTFKTVSKIPEQTSAYNTILLANEAIERELMYNEASWNDYIPLAIAEKYRSQKTQHDFEVYPDVDWADYMLRDVASDQRVNISVRGGNNLVKYFSNISYQHEGDMFKSFDNGKGYKSGFNFNRFNYRSNLDFNVTKTTKFSVNVSGSYGVRRAPSTDDRLLYGGIYRIGRKSYYPMHEDGTFGFLNDEWNLTNPLAAYISSGTTTSTFTRINTDFVLEQDLSFITKGLKLKGRFTYDNNMTGGQTIRDFASDKDNSNIIFKKYTNDGQNVEYRIPAVSHDFDFVYKPWELDNIYIWDGTRARRLNYEISLDYNRSFGKHNLTALALFKREQYSYGSMFPRFREDWVGRVTYNYDYTYFGEINGAYNGSEMFGPGYRFDLFPSVALGWMASNEKFMKNITWLDKLKFRGSLGLVGDDNFSGRWKYITQWGNYADRARINAPGVFANYSDAEKSPYVMYRELSLGNPDLHWEKSVKSDIGVEMSILKNRINIDFDYFWDHRKDILIGGASRSIPDFFGAIAPDANLGEVKVKGYELVVNANQRFDNVYLWADLSFTHAEDLVIFKDDPELMPDYQKAAGYPIGQIYSAIPGKIMQSWDDVYMSTPVATGQDYLRTGYYDVIDYDGNGIYDPNYDQVPTGFPTRPQNTWTCGIGGEYKGLSLSVQFYGQTNTNRYVNLSLFTDNSHIYFEDRLDYWSKENPQNTRTLEPWKLKQGNNDPYKDLYDASMVRLKMIEIAYQIPKAICGRIGVKGLRVFLNGNNLFLWTNLPDDRDFSEGETSFRGAYPTMRRFNIGFNLDL